MKNDERTIYVGLDVDDKAFHGHAYDSSTLLGTEFKCKPSVAALTKALAKICKDKEQIKCCYETGHLGFSLQRALTKQEYHCDVVASALIPRQAGKQVKTDRIDSKKLSYYYLRGDLTVVHVPDEKEEAIRNLIRSRSFMKKQTKSFKQFIIFLCRGKGLHYRGEGKSKKSYWTKSHMTWLEAQKNLFKNDEAFCFNLSMLLDQLHQMNLRLASYEAEIDRTSQLEKYAPSVKALTCYRGLDTLSAMTLITEIGDIKRFSHPAKLCSYAGLDIREFSSGGREVKFGITKIGNRRIRTTVVEAAQQSWRAPHINKRVKKVRTDSHQPCADIADRCMHRLYSKSKRLLMRGKEKNKVTVACARELLCFIWESLYAVAA